MKNKYYANKGVTRNKKPLSNLIYTFEVKTLKEGVNIEEFKDFKFKDLGYISGYVNYEKGSMKGINFWLGFITPKEVKELIGEKQWGKFCGEGKRVFVVQRRENGNNIPISLNKKDK